MFSFRNILIFVIFLIQTCFAQLTLEYQSQIFPYSKTAGWFAFRKVNDNWEWRMYDVDSTAFHVYSSHYDGSVQYSYNFTPEERRAGGRIYSLLVDLTGDGIVEFYVLGQFGNSTNPQQSVRILNIVDNSTLLELNRLNYYYSSPNLYDIDGDDNLEMIFVEYNVLNSYSYKLLVYQTSVLSSELIDIEKTNFHLNQNFPNPFNLETIIEFTIPKYSNVKLEIFNVQGKKVKTLINGNLDPGLHRLQWYGTDEYNSKLPSGVYFYQLTFDDLEQTKKMILLK